MKKLFLIAALTMTAQGALAGTNVIYGQDNRKDLYQVSNALHLRLAQSTAGMVHVGMFAQGSAQGYFNLNYTVSLEKAENLCTSERFAQQQLAPQCSGFLVGPDTLVTAGHCYVRPPVPQEFGKPPVPQETPESLCQKYAWVFDYNISTPGKDPIKNLPVTNIYRCSKVISAQRDANYDYAIIKLDRPVVGRAPLSFRTTGTVPNNTSLVVIGHPNGLPTKVTDNGRITYNSEPTRFSTNLDTFHGNSGAAVFDANTGLVEGILIMGKADYRPSIPSNPKSCNVVNVCSENATGCTAGIESGTVLRGEVVLRIAPIASLISTALRTR